MTLHWRHNDHDGDSNHQPHDCLLNRLFRRRSKKTSKLRVTGLCVGNSPGPVNSPHKGPVTRKMFPFDDVIMTNLGSRCLTGALYPHLKNRAFTNMTFESFLWTSYNLKNISYQIQTHHFWSSELIFLNSFNHHSTWFCFYLVKCN